MNGHPQFDEDIDLYALGSLEGEERQALEQHLLLCPECARKLEEAQGRLALLALTVEPQPPPARVKERLLQQVRSQRVPQPLPLWIVLQRWATPALALATAALAITAGILAVENKALTRQVSELQAAARQQQVEMARARAVLEVLTAHETVQLTLVSGAARPLPQGKVFYHSRKGLLFYASNLPTLAREQTYQLWLIPAEGNPVSAGIFVPDARGDGAVLLPALPVGLAARAFAVTIEPAGGVPQPTGPKVLLGAIS